MRFSDPELLNPVVHCFARCHWCKNLVPIKSAEDGSLVLDEQPCPKCGAELSDSQIFHRFLENLYHTGAITSANKFISFDLAVIPFMVVRSSYPIGFSLIATTNEKGQFVSIFAPEALSLVDPRRPFPEPDESRFGSRI